MKRLNPRSWLMRLGQSQHFQSSSFWELSWRFSMFWRILGYHSTGIFFFNYKSNQIIKAVLRIQIRWICNILASWIRIRICKNMRIHGSGSKDATKNSKQKNLLLKPKSDLSRNKINY